MKRNGWIVLSALVWACGPTVPPELAEIATLEHRRAGGSPRWGQLVAADDPRVRERAVLALGRIQSLDDAPLLLQAIDDPEPAVREAAIFAVGQLGMVHANVPAEEALAARLPDALAVEALGKLAGPTVVDRLLPLATHEDPRVREEVGHGLMRARFVSGWRGDETTPDWSDATVRTLARLLDDEVAEVRRAAAHALARFGEARAVAALAAHGDEPDRWTRVFVARALARSGEDAAVAALLPYLDDGELHVRTEAVRGLIALGAADRVPVGLAADPSFHVRTAVASACAARNDAQGLETLRALATDASPTVAAAAVRGLAARLGEGYLEAAGERLRAEAVPLRLAAVDAAGTIETGLPLLLRAANDDDPIVRAQAIRNLGTRWQAPGAAEAVLSGLAADALAVRGTAVGVLAAVDEGQRLAPLIAAYQDSPGVEWIEVRESIVDALEGVAAATDFLTEVAGSDPTASVRDKAAKAVGVQAADLGDESAKRPDFALDITGEPEVILETSKGAMTIRLFPDDAPLHVANFLSLVREGVYDGLSWHRVVSNFVIQGGDPDGTGWGGPGYTIPDEINRRRYDRGSVGMPKAGKDTGGCQLFIDHLPTPHLDGNYTIFGRVVDGLEVIDAIEVGDTIDRARVAG